MTGTTLEGAPREHYGDAWRVPEFRALFLAYTVSLLGDVVAAVALTVLIFERTGSPFAASLAFTLAFTPHVVGGTLLAGLADRVPPRRLLVACDLVAGGLVATMALPEMPTAAQLGLLAATGLLAPVAAGASAAILPDVAPGAFVPARSLFRLVAQGGQVVGNALAGGLLVALSPRGALAADAASFVVSAALIGFGTRRRPARARADGSVVGASLRNVRRTLAAADLRRVLTFMWLVPTFAVAPEALAAAYVGRLDLQAAAVGLLLTAIPAGTILGQLLGVRSLRPARQVRLVRPLAALVFVPLLIFAVQPPLPVAYALLVLSGVASMYGLGLDRVLLGVVPDDRRGAVFGLVSAGLMTLQGLGFACAGLLAEVVAPGIAVALAGVAGLALVAALRLPSAG